MGIILGAGIYVIIGEAAGSAGSAVWLSFLIAAIVAGASGLAYAELAAMFPEAGASSTYAREAFGRRTGFIVGWLRIAVDVVAAAAVALGFGGYLEDLVGFPSELAAFAILGLCGGIVIFGVRQTVALAAALALIEAAGLLFVIIMGLPHVGSRDLFATPEGLGGVLGGAALLFFAFEGFEQVATLSEEAKEPTRTIPRAIIVAIGITTALYLLVAVTAVSVVDWTTLAGSASPLAEVIRAEAGDRPADALSTVALLATGNTVLMLLATGARLTYGMAARDLLPPWLSKVHAARRTPWTAALAVTAPATLLTLAGDIGLIAQVTNAAVFTAFVIVNGAVIRLRFTQPEAPRPFRLAGSVAGMPLAALVGGVGATLLSFSMDLEGLLGGIAIVLAGLAASVIAMRHGSDETLTEVMP